MNSFLLLIISLTFSFAVQAEEYWSRQGDSHTLTTLLMGSRFEITAIHKNEEFAKEKITLAKVEIERLEDIISSWKEESETFRINRNAGIKPIKVSEELFHLIKRCIKVSDLTKGAFDISYASIDKIWKFDGSMSVFPDSNTVRNSIKYINYKNIILNKDASTVFLKEKGMRIGFGAIGKGFAANKAKAILQNNGILAGVVNAGGDLIVWGDRDWNIGIADPNNKDASLSWLKLNNASIVTSGNYEKHIEFNGKRYGHIINPQTGYPTLGIKSVSIVCPDAELSDALATAIFVLGVKDGLTLINTLKTVECLIIDDNMALLSSKNLTLNYYKETIDYQINE